MDRPHPSPLPEGEGTRADAGSGDRSTRHAASSVDVEFATLTAALRSNPDLADALLRLEPIRARVEQAKLEALAEFAAGAGHEINNPIATISGRVQLLLRDEADPERRQALLAIGAQAWRVRDMIGDLMLFGRPPEPRKERVELGELVRAAVEPLYESIAAKRATIDLRAEAPVYVEADPVQLKVVISALVQNSLNALEAGGPITLATSVVDERGQLWGALTVTDRGVGLSDLDREHLFDPFYSGRQAGRGLGFGLSKAWRIVSNHGGRIDVDSVPGGETTFRVLLPAM